ncbi:hypothetical protein G3N57_33215, partial [Paraburkholderia sp. Se-20369]|nr:hypothetical protein [Paraburkholderia sp. Se-20369]
MFPMFFPPSRATRGLATALAAAAALALGVAYLLELETPYSAASTVLLVINPVQGAVIGKGVWRVVAMDRIVPACAGYRRLAHDMVVAIQPLVRHDQMHQHAEAK